MPEQQSVRQPDFQYFTPPNASEPALHVFLSPEISQENFLATHPGLQMSGDQLRSRREIADQARIETMPLSSEPQGIGEVQMQHGEMQSEITVIPRLNPADRKKLIQSTVHNALQVGKNVESETNDENPGLRFFYDLAAQKIWYNPDFILGRMVEGISGEGRIQQAALLASQDILRSIFEQHFPEFQGKAGVSLHVIGNILKHPLVSWWLQFVPSIDAIADGFLAAADAVDGKSLFRLGADAAIMGYDALPFPTPGDVALFSPGLDKSERILQYSLMEILYIGMTDPESPIYGQRELIADAVLHAQSLIARAANVTLLNEEKSLGGKMGVIKSDDRGDLFVKLGPVKIIPLTHDAKTPEGTLPYADRLLDPLGKAEELRTELTTQGNHTSSEYMQLAMCNLIITAQEIAEKGKTVIDTSLQNMS